MTGRHVLFWVNNELLDGIVYYELPHLVWVQTDPDKPLYVVARMSVLALQEA